MRRLKGEEDGGGTREAEVRGWRRKMWRKEQVDEVEGGGG